MNAHVSKDSAIDGGALRQVLGNFATGVTVITTLGDGNAPVGMTANSFSSVSLDPPLILWSIGLKAPSLGAFRGHTAFAINIMCADSEDLAMNFARPSDDKFAGINWHAGLDGVPVLDDALAVIQCRVENRIAGGDHEIYLGRVHEFHSTEKAPLLFHKGKFATLGEST